MKKQGNIEKKKKYITSSKFTAGQRSDLLSYCLNISDDVSCSYEIHE